MAGAVPWLASGTLLILSIRLAARTPGDRLEELDRHIMRCRRRQEAASVLVARFNAHNGLTPADLRARLRLTDSIAVRRSGRAFELAGVFDEHGLDRAGVERRLRALAGGVDVAVGWALFPEDGVTLRVLLDSARAALPVPAVRRPAPSAAKAGVGPAPLTSGADGE
jgi:hypothetical protein